jgi:multidrug efflux pump subunit AcrB
MIPTHRTAARKGEPHGKTERSANWFARFHQGWERGFELFRRGYLRVLTMLLKRRWIIPLVALLMLSLGGVMFALGGLDFFPDIDGGQIKLHVRAPAGTRIEATERIFQQIENKIREDIPEKERDLIVDDIGVPQRVYNLAFTDGSTIGVNDGVMLISLEDGHAPTANYMRRPRDVPRAALPSVGPSSTGCGALQSRSRTPYFARNTWRSASSDAPSPRR